MILYLPPMRVELSAFLSTRFTLPPEAGGQQQTLNVITAGGPFTLQTGLDLTEAGGAIAIEPPVEPVTPGTVVPVASVFNGGNVRA